MDNNKQIQALRCIEYPGLVQNVDNMLKTLGGINKISGVSMFSFIPSHSHFYNSIVFLLSLGLSVLYSSI